MAKSKKRNAGSGGLGRTGKSERGGATLIGVVLAALGTLAATAAINAKINGAQDQTLAAHGAVQSQSKAWVASEAVRRYLISSTSVTVAALTGDLPITGLGGATATVVSNVASSTGGRRLVVDIRGSGAVGTSMVEAVYDVVAGASTSSGGGVTIPAAGLSLNGNTVISGGVIINGPAGSPSASSIYVFGSLNISGTSPGVSTVCASGDVTLASAVSVMDLCTNANLYMTGSSAVTRNASVKGNVSMGSSVGIFNLLDNGTVSLTNGSIATAASTGAVTVSGGNSYITNLTTQSNVAWSSTSNQKSTIKANGTVSYAGTSANTVISSIGSVAMVQGASASSVSTEGDVSVGAYTTPVASVMAKGKLILTNEGSQVAGGKYGGSLGSYASYTQAYNGYNAANNTNNYNKALGVTGFDPGVSAVTVASAGFLPSTPPLVDVALLRSQANYAFDINSVGKITVDVKNVNGITDGTYFLGKYKINYTDYYDYICSSVDASGYCVLPVAPTKRIIQGQSAQNEGLSYAGGTWTFNAISMAPGIAWFNGNLKLGNGTYYTSFQATGNLDTNAGNVTDSAPNWAGYGPICLNNTSGSGLPVTDFNGVYPTQLCDIAHATYVPSPAGNVAYMAGSYSGGSFVGGNVSTGASNLTYGTIVAGNQFVSNGSSTITGSVMSAGQGGSVGNALGGSTTINQSNAPSTFSTTVIACSGACASPSATSLVRNYWTRYK